MLTISRIPYNSNAAIKIIPDGIPRRTPAGICTPMTNSTIAAIPVMKAGIRSTVVIKREAAAPGRNTRTHQVIYSRLVKNIPALPENKSQSFAVKFLKTIIQITSCRY